MNKTLLLSAAFSVISFASFAAEYEVKMLNKGSDGTSMVFEPRLTVIQPGDTVKFVPVDRGHNVESFKDGIPEGTEAFKGAIGKEVVITFDKEGVYTFKCTPHVSMAMIGAIVVGSATNIDQVAEVKAPGAKAKAAYEELMSEIRALPAAAPAAASEADATAEPPATE